MELEKMYKRNTNPKLYEEEQDLQNCGSFALGIDGWYCPYIERLGPEDEDALWQYEEYERTHWMEELVNDNLEREEVMLDIIEKDFEFILKTCPWLEPIDEDEVYNGGRVIAYRLSMNIPDERSEFDVDEDTDFHFRVLIDGEWWEKNGAGPVHKVDDPDCDVWEVDDWLVYDGPVRYAKFRQEEI